MHNKRITKEERINARVNEMRAHRKSVQRKKNIPVIVSFACAAAFLVGGSALGISLINNTKPAAQTVQSSVPAKNAQKAQNTAQVTSIQTSSQDNMPTYDENTNSYSYSFTGYENSDYNNDENFSHSETSGFSGSTYVHDNSAAQPTYTGTHHSGASWNGTGSPLHFTENGKTSKGYDWRYEGGNGLVDLGCDYTFDGSSYDFSLIGKEPGSGSITVWHNTDNNTQVPTTINFTVDDNLNVSYN